MLIPIDECPACNELDEIAGIIIKITMNIVNNRFRPSLNIEQAWQLVDSYMPGHSFMVHRESDQSLDFFGWGEEHRWTAGCGIMTSAPTAPLAITRAFCKAHGVEEIEVHEKTP